MTLLIGFLAIVAAGVYVALPLLRPHEQDVEDSGRESREALVARRDALYREIADLDFDFGAGKVDERGYQAERAECLDEAAAVLEALDETAPATGAPGEDLAELHEQIEAEIRRLRRGPLPR